MEFNLLTFWNNELGYGSSILDYNNGNETEKYTRALFGISYNREEKRFFIDLFWRYFPI